MKFLILLCCLVSGLNSLAQNPALDTMKKRLARAVTSEEKVEILGRLSRTLMTSDIESANAYAEQMNREAELSRNRKLMVKSLLVQGERHSYLSFKKDFIMKSIDYYNQSLELAKTNELEKETVKAYLGLSSVYTSIPDLDKAIGYTTQALSISNSLNDDTLMVSSYNSFGVLYQLKKERSLSLRNYLTSLRIAEEAKNSFLLRNCYANLSRFYADVKEFDKSIDFAQKSMNELSGVKPENEKYQRVVDLYTLGNLYSQKKNYEMSSYYYDRSIQLADSIKYPTLKMPGYEGLLQQYVKANQPQKALDFLNNRADLRQFIVQFGSGYIIDGTYGIIFSKLGRFDSAKYYFEKAEPHYETSGTIPYKAGFYYQYADYFNKSGKVDKAIEYYEKSKTLADQIANIELQEIVAKELDSVYAKTGDFKKSHYYNRLYYQYKDSLQKLGEEKKLMELEIKDEQQRQLRKEREEAAALERRHTVQYTGIAIAIALVFVLLVAMGIFRVSETTIRIMGFFSFILLFEFIILLADARIHHWTHGEPLPVLGIKIVLIAMLLPLHHWLEHKVVSYLASRRLILPSGKTLWSSLKPKKSQEH